jgi:hypothetical protein
MGFFKWIPNGSGKMVSPYLAVYGGLTLCLTCCIFYFWGKWIEKDQEEGAKEATRAMDSDDVSLLEEGLRLAESAETVELVDTMEKGWIDQMKDTFIRP